MGSVRADEMESYVVQECKPVVKYRYKEADASAEAWDVAPPGERADDPLLYELPVATLRPEHMTPGSSVASVQIPPETVQPTPDIPLPAAMWLFLGGAALFFAIGRMRG